MVHQASLATHGDRDHRTAPRRAVAFRALVRETGAAVTTVAVINLSTDGCRFRSPELFETATTIWLKIDGIGGRQARIVWRIGDLHGCEFVAPVQTRTLDEVCAAPLGAPAAR